MVLIGVCLIFCMFPFWCSLVMKLLCKSFSDKFIVRFLSIVCPIPLVLKSILREVYDEIDDPIGFRIASVLFSIFLNYWICKLLAKGGVTIMNKRNPNKANEPTSNNAGDPVDTQSEAALF